MKGIYNEFTELIGNTPMLHMRNLENDNDLKATVLAKLELFNPQEVSRTELQKQ